MIIHILHMQLFHYCYAFWMLSGVVSHLCCKSGGDAPVSNEIVVDVAFDACLGRMS